MKPYYSINTNRLLQKDFCIAVIAPYFESIKWTKTERLSPHKHICSEYVFLFLLFFTFCDVSFNMCISLFHVYLSFHIRKMLKYLKDINMLSFWFFFTFILFNFKRLTSNQFTFLFFWFLYSFFFWWFILFWKKVYYFSDSEFS